MKLAQDKKMGPTFVNRFYKIKGKAKKERFEGKPKQGFFYLFLTN